MTDDDAPRHDRPSDAPRQPPLTDPDLATLSHAELARTLAASSGTAVLATSARKPEGYPYASLVTYALDDAGRPILIISDMAEHTRNLRRDPRCSLLVAEMGDGDPLGLGRVTLVGRAALVVGADLETATARFVERHPDAGFYVRFKDFAVWRIEIESARYIGGFGRMSWVTGDAWAGAAPDPIAPHVRAIVEHMNDDHGDAVLAYAQAFTRAGSDAQEAVMTGVDRLGFDLRVVTSHGPAIARVLFDDEVKTSKGIREAMVALVQRARAELAASALE